MADITLDIEKTDDSELDPNLKKFIDLWTPSQCFFKFSGNWLISYSLKMAVLICFSFFTSYCIYLFRVPILTIDVDLFEYLYIHSFA